MSEQNPRVASLLPRRYPGLIGRSALVTGGAGAGLCGDPMRRVRWGPILLSICLASRRVGSR
jgi:hypothetical protein